MKTYPLNSSQLGVFYEWEKDHSSMQYNLAYRYHFSDSVDTEKLKVAIETVIKAYPILTVRFKYIDDEIRQYVPENVPAAQIPIVQASESEVAAISRDFVKPFNLLGESLARFKIIRTETTVYLLVDIHHSIVDGTTIYLLFNRALNCAYCGESFPAETLTLFVALAEEQKNFDQEKFAGDEEFFARKISGTQMTRFSGTQTNQRGEWCSQAVFFPRQPIDNFFQKNNAKPNGFFLTAFALCLIRFTREETVMLTTAHHGRIDKRLKDTFGMFVRTVPLALTLAPEKSIQEQIAEVTQEIHETFGHLRVPFAHLAQKFGLGLDIAYTYQRGLSHELDFAGGKATMERLYFGAAANSITAALYERSDQYEFRLEYSDARLSAAEAKLFLDALEVCVASMIGDSQQLCKDVDIVSKTEKAELLKLSKGEILVYDEQETLIDLFVKQVREYPNKRAVVDKHSSLTYAELDNAANVIAEELVKRIVGRDQFVGVMLPCRKEFLVAALGIMKAGSAYIPLDYEYPNDRLLHMLTDSASKILITTRALYEEKQKAGDFNVENILFVDEINFTNPSGQYNKSKPAGLAYMIYTSGSTGKPKGVMIQHQALRAFIAWNQHCFALTAKMRVALHPSFSFDASIIDLFLPLTVGGEVHILSSSLRKNLDGIQQYIKENEITAMSTSTQVGMELLNNFDVPLEYLTMGGEKMLPTRATNIPKTVENSNLGNLAAQRGGDMVEGEASSPTRLGYVKVINAYGPTEFTICSSFHAVAAGEKHIPIGRPVPNSAAYVVGRNDDLMPRGTAGELCLCGTQIAKGYWHRDDLTAEKFIDCPFQAGKKMYRTGDLVRWNEQGELEYLGRIDTQVKLRGYRIELGEIEAAISNYPHIKSAVVCVQEIGGTSHLIGYFTATEEIDIKKLREFLAGSLTEFMIPTTLMPLENFPLTPNGKVNRQALPIPELDSAEIVSPETADEKFIFVLAKKVLNTDTFGVTSNLFSLGLTSLLAIRFSLNINRELAQVANPEINQFSTQEILANPTIRQLALLFAEKASGVAVADASAELSLSAYPPQEFYPLTENQRGVYIDWEQNRDAIQYNIPLCFKFGKLDLNRLQNAFAKLFAAHTYLKTRIVRQQDEQYDELYLQRGDDAPVEIRVEEIDAELTPEFFQSRVLPFNLLAENLYRIEAFVTAQHTYLFFDVHHIIFDGLSVQLFLRDLMAAYAGEEIAPEKITAYDLALYSAQLVGILNTVENSSLVNLAAQRGGDMMEGEASSPTRLGYTPEFAAAEKYFDELVKGFDSTVFPAFSKATGKDAGNDAGKLASFSVTFPRTAIHRTSKQLGVTESNFLMNAFLQVLARFTHADEVLISTISSGRSHSALSSTFGMLVKTLPVPFSCRRELVADAVRRLQAQQFATLRRDFYPYTQLVQRHGIKPHILFAFQGGVTDEIGSSPLSLGGEFGVPIPLTLTQAKVPIIAEVFLQGDQYRFKIDYDSAKFSEIDIKTFAESLVIFAQNSAASPNVSVSEIQLLPAKTQELLAKFSSGETLFYDPSLTILDLFAEQVTKNPDAVAVVFGEKKLTYQELDAQTTRIAKHLVKHGVGLEQVVGVMIERSELLAIYPLAVLKAGAAYMPLDFHFPADRLSFMVNDANVKIILTDEKNRVTEAIPDFAGLVLTPDFLTQKHGGTEKNFNPENAEVQKDSEGLNSASSVFPSIPSALLRASVPPCEPPLPEAQVTASALPVIKPENIFVVLYTSGSTGQPKGVALEHRGLTNFCLLARQEYELTAQDRTVGYSNFGFDAHMFDLYPTFIAGAAVYIIPSEKRLDLMWLNSYIEANNLTFAFLTTQIAKQFIDLFDNRSMRLLTAGGEKMPAIRKPRYRFIQAYGPTECTIFTTNHEINADFDSPVIGRPLPNYALYVLDQNLQLVPPGVYGELCIGGIGVAREYLNRPELTAEKFVTINIPNTVENSNLGNLAAQRGGDMVEGEASRPARLGQKLYRSGDLVRWNFDGEIEFAGRLDNQVKMRGLRIELGEIEAAISRFPDISAAVVAVQDIGGNQQLVGYFVAAEKIAEKIAVKIDTEKLREFLAESLTEFMIPTTLMQLESFPLTPNGKVNRKALPLPVFTETTIELPQNQRESEFLEMVGELLSVDHIGVTSNLIMYGLTSLLAIKLSGLVNRNFGLDLTTKDILSAPTVRQMVSLMVEHQDEPQVVYENSSHSPSTPHVKVNRKVLPQIATGPVKAAETTLQRQIIKIAAEVIGIEPQELGIDTNLITAGMNSLLAIRFAVKLSQQFNCVVSGGDVLRTHTIEDLAKMVVPPEFYPLNSSQLGIFYEWEKDHSSMQYNLPFRYQFAVSVDTNKLHAAIETVVKAYPLLAVRFKYIDDEIRQYVPKNTSENVSKNNAIDIPIIQATENEIAAISKDFVKPFNLLGEPLARFKIIRTETAVYLFVDIHHCIVDGTSYTIIFNRALNCAYRGESFPAESLTLFDAVAEEQQNFDSGQFAADEEFFARKISGLSMTQFPNAQNSSQRGEWRSQVVCFPRQEIDSFFQKTFARANGFFLTAFALCLSRFTREETVVLTTAHHGRIDKRLKDTFGMFVRTVPLALTLTPNNSVQAQIAEVTQEIHDGFGHLSVPFAHLAQKFGFGLDITYTYQRGLAHEFAFAGDQATMTRLYFGAAANNITAALYEQPDQYEFRLEYSDARLAEDEAKLFLDSLAACVASMIGDEQKSCKDVEIVSEQHKQTLAQFEVGEKLDYDKSLTMLDLFAAQVAKTPDAVAIVFGEKTLTYQELDALTTRMAKYLVGIRFGIAEPSSMRPLEGSAMPNPNCSALENVIGVMIERSELLALYPIAVLKAGAAYMPLDFHFPAERLAFMVNDAGVRIILTDEKNRVAEAIPDFAGRVLTSEFFANDVDNKIDEAELAAIALPRVSPNNMFVVLYTSGSTGQPKGVVLEHGNLVNFSIFAQQKYAITPADRVVAYANFGFDAHMLDVFPTLISGASLYVVPAEMRMELARINAYIDTNNLTVVFFTTQIAKQFVDLFDNKTLRLLTTGGEKLPAVRKPHYRFINGYGPTECTIFATNYEIITAYDSTNIGKPLPNYTIYVLDQNLRALPPGVAGELCIGGAGVGREYLNRPELTAEKFVMINGEKIYRTGDLVRWNSDGDIEFIGRIDNQVKMRGLRIELGEIEAAISRFAGITASVVVVHEIGGNQQLVGYFTALEEINEKIDADKLREFLASSLTEFMIPTVLMQVDKFALTPNGKVNRKALPVPVLTEASIELPQNQREAELLEMVGELLSVDHIGVTSNLVMYGLTSLLAIKLSTLVHRKFGLDLTTKHILSAPTVRQMAELAIDNKDEIKVAHETRPHYPLSENQRGLYVSWEQNRSALQYNMPFAFKFGQKVDITKLEAALHKFFAAHPYLKTKLSLSADDVCQLQRDDAPVQISTIILAAEPLGEFFQTRVRAFNLLADDLYRIELYQSPAAVYLFMDFHHIIFDGGSMAIFFNDLRNAYLGETLQPETFTAFAAALEEVAILNSLRYQEAENYFDNLLNNCSMTALPLSSSTENKSGSGIVKIYLERTPIETFCKRSGVTANNFFLTALTQVLHRITREENVLITSISNGRADLKKLGLCGMFVKTLPVVSRTGSQKVGAALQAMQSQFIETLGNDFYPFTHLSVRHNLQPQIMFAYQGDAANYQIVLDNEISEAIPLTLNTTKFPLAINIVAVSDARYEVSLEFDRSLYGAADIELLGKCLCTFAASCLSIDSAITEIDIVSKEEKTELLDLSKGEELIYDENETLIDLFVKQVRVAPDKCAVVDKNSSLTYAELDNAANVIADELAKRFSGRDQFVGVMLPRRKEFLVSALGIMKAGSAYIPLDHEYPNDRLLHMLADSAAKILITTRALYAEKQKAGDFNVENILFVDETEAGGFGYAEPKLPNKTVRAYNESTPTGLAYMIYTSGSTGKPKGVMIQHQALRAFIAWNQHCFALTSKMRVALHPSFSFDASVIDLFLPLTVGGEVHIFGSALRKNLDEIHRYIKANAITGMSISTQAGMELLNNFEVPLEYIIMGGEKLLPIRETNTKLINGYGPTEFTVCSSFHAVAAGEKDIPIGRPVPNSAAYIVDRHRRLMPRGVAGELCLCGVQIAQGYWHRDDLTAEKFVDCPFQPQQKMYRTGDLVRWNEQGELEYLGRIDTQVKLRGYRIELGEIEAVINSYPSVQSAVVLVHEINGAQHLVGYFTATENIDSEKLREFLSGSLSEFMIPTVLMQLEKFPLTPNGKVDLKKLPAPQLAARAEYEPPKNELEKTLQQIFCAALNLEQVSVTDSFFELGGTSLLVTRVLSKAQANGYPLSYAEVFQKPTPRALAELLQQRGEKPKTIIVSRTNPATPNTNVDSDGFDYSAINELLARNNLETFNNGESLPLGNVLLTGATGFLGIHVLYELLQRTDGLIYCLVRGGKGDAQERLKQLLFYYFEEPFAERFGAQIIVSTGDVNDTESLAKLAQYQINTVINCAANVKHFSAGSDIEDVNFGGIINLIEFCKKIGARLVQVSTTSIAGLSINDSPPPTTIMDEQMLWFGQSIDQQYLGSKFRAERAALAAMTESRDDFSVKIMRVGNLMGRQRDGEFQINFRSNSFVGSLRAYTILGCVPYDLLTLPTEFAPIDSTASAIIHLATTPRECVVFHPYNDHEIFIGDVLDALNRSGQIISFVEPSAFATALRLALQDETKAKFLTPLIAYANETQGRKTALIKTTNNYTSQILRRRDFHWNITSDNYLDKFIDGLRGLDFFE